MTNVTATESLTRRGSSVSWVMMLLALLAHLCAAADLQSKHQFSIPPQALDTALLAFSDQGKVQVLMWAVADSSAKSAGAEGELSSLEALKSILASTGFNFKQVDKDTIAIVRETAGLTTLSEEGGEALTEIIVTAQKREQRLQDVPISMEVLSGKDLDRSSVRGVTDALNQIGGVSTIEDRPGKARVSIRGVVSPDENVGTSPVGYYLDEVPFTFLTRGELPDTNAYDLARVEVLRGPQGTLYGVNALSGVVRVLTNDPDLDAFEAKVRTRVSQTAHGGTDYNGDIALNVPLIPGELALRGVASYSYISGFIDSTTDGQKGINSLEAQSYRFKLSYRPSEDLNFKLGLTRSVLDNAAPSISFAGLTTPNTSVQPDLRVYDTSNLISEYTMDFASLTSSTAFLQYHTDTTIEIEPGLGYFEHVALHSFSEEVKLASHLQGPWQWSVGGIYKDTAEPFLQAAPDFGFAVPFQNEAKSKSYAIFGEVTRSFAQDRFELTGGLRYFNDRLASPSTNNFGDPIPATQYATYDHVTGRFVATYKPRPDRMLYASVATGFRSGETLDASFATVVQGIPPLRPDSLITYETGTKGSVLNGNLSYEAAVYYTDWKDIQQILITPDMFSTGINAGRARGPGADGSVAFQPLRALTLRASLGWNNLKFDRDVYLINTAGGPSEALFASKGNRLNFSPEWTGSISGSYRTATTLAGVSALVNAYYLYRTSLQDRVLSGTTPVSIDASTSGTQRVLNVSVGVETARWSVQLYADNALDARESIYPSFDNYNIYQRPRTIGLQAAFDYH
jgi:iron complex outermembrane recepter protein